MNQEEVLGHVCIISRINDGFGEDFGIKCSYNNKIKWKNNVS